VDLVCYPIKSCGGIHLKEAEVATHGLLHDREWAIVQRPNVVVSLRFEPRLQNLFPAFELDAYGKATALVLNYEGFAPCKVDISKPSTFQPFEFDYVIKANAVEVSQEASAWCEAVFKKDYFLAHIESHRQCAQSKPELAERVSTVDSASFQDYYHNLLCSEESFQELRRRLPKYRAATIEMVNMRPNIVVKHVKTPFDEDSWSQFTIGNLPFNGIGECNRCKATTINVNTLEYDPDFEPVRTLKEIHGDTKRGFFGLWAHHLKLGTVRLGDKVIVQSRRAPLGQTSFTW
jgi:uncharacterized protein YcbX